MKATAESPPSPRPSPPGEGGVKPRQQNPPPPPGKPLFRRATVYKRKFKLPEGGGEGVAEFHPDKLVLRKVRGRRRTEYAFTKLWAVWTEQLV